MSLCCTSVGLEVPARVLCRDLTMSVEPGELWAVLGRNGTGKTTFLHALGGLIEPAHGHVDLDGMRVAQHSARNRAQAVGVLLQMEEGSYWGTVEQYVLLGRFPHTAPWRSCGGDDSSVARAMLEAVGMLEFAQQSYSSLSGGERQRARIAQILAQEPKFYLLDEPLQHLDLAHQSQMVALMRALASEHGKSAVMVLHEPLWIGRSCTHALVFLGDGTAAAGAADDILTRERLEHAYGCRLREVAHGCGRSFVPDV